MAQAGNIVARLQLRVDEFRQGIQDAQQQLTNFSNTTRTIATAAGVAFAAIGTAVAGVGAAAAKMAIDQENAMAKMQAATGATKQEMAEFKDIADNLFKNGRGNYEEIYNTLTQVKQVLGQTGSEAEATADKALIMSKTFGWEVTESIRAASTASNTFGVDSAKSFDMFTALAQQAGDKSGDLLDTFNEYAPIVNQMGLSFEDFGNILAKGMEKGAFNFDKIGDALKEFNIRAQDGSKTTIEAFQALGLNADKMGSDIAAGGEKGREAFNKVLDGLAKIEDPMKRNEIGVKLFGSMWEDLGQEVILSMGQADGALKNVEGSVSRAGQALDETLGHKIEKIKNSFLLWAKDLGEQFMPKLKELADFFITNMPAIQAAITPIFTTLGNVLLGIINALISVASFVAQNATAFKILGAVIAGVVLPPMLGFLLNAIRIKTQALVGLITNTFRLIAANYALGMSFLAANLPLLGIIIGIGLLIAAIVLIVKHWDTIKAKTLEVWESIKAYLGSAWEWVKAQFQTFLNWLSAIWSSVWGTIKAVGEAIWNGIKAAFFAVWNAMWNVVATILAVIYALIMTAWEGIKKLAQIVWGYIGDYVIGIWNGIKSAALTIWNALKAYFTTVLNFYKTIFTTVWNAIKSVLTVVWNAIKSVAITVFNNLKNNFMTVLNAIKTVFTTVWNAIKSFLLPIWYSLKSSAMSIFNAMKSTLTSIFNSIKSVLTSVWNSIKSVLTSVWNSIRSVASNVWSGISSVISSMVNGIRSKISGAASFMRNTFSGAVNAVKSAFSGMWSSIRQSLQNVVDGIRSKVAKAKEYLNNLNPFKRNSPSLVDNVLSGTKIIRQTYESLSGMQLAPPTIGSITAGRIDVESAFGGGNSGSGGGTNYNAPLVQVENMHVRSDQDVRGVSRELFNLQRSHDRARGGR
ncbi:phage tail tape measure protein [Cytobacillus pseudoceanisediminis]|uniref:phage tail tape measure protein n=1 Tax=Cytobacillus pseudoceanisediminis TaxID=3051614 RepID=UPI003CF627DC